MGALPPPGPVRNGSGNGQTGLDGRRCPCGVPVPSPRAQFCSVACRVRAHRRRHAQPALLADRGAPQPAPWPQVYECPECEQRYCGERRCPDCNLWTRKLGPGGPCPHCDEAVVIDELLTLTTP